MLRMRASSRHLHRFVLRPVRGLVHAPSTRRNATSTSRLAQPLGHGLIPRVQRRGFFAGVLPPLLVPPAVFTALLVGLWTYKCLMTVVFQDKVIYMSYMPPFARSEKIEDYAKTCHPVKWEEKRIRSVDGTKLALVIGSIGNPASGDDVTEVVICYFQGNGSSPPPRLPLLSNLLRLLQDHNEDGKMRYTIIALSYRGYWKSSGRATQTGIELDAQALIQWTVAAYSNGPASKHLRLILWGQSIGAGVAATAAASHLSETPSSRLPIAGLILETPFTNIKSMLLALYPQKWLPYRYLWPFLWNHWDSEKALRKIAESDQRPRVMLMPATRDEVVPAQEIEKLASLCAELGLETERRDVVGALHTEATMRREGQEAVAEFVRGLPQRNNSHN